MNTAGVSFTAAASPMAMPTPRRRPAASSTRSIPTSTASTRLTWPNPSVSRIGSSATTRGSTSTSRYQVGQPHRSASGRKSHQTTSRTNPRFAASISGWATQNGSAAIGLIATAANGG